MPASVTLVRHAETKANAARLWQGQSDAGLSDLGTTQAEALAKRLAGEHFDIVVSSDLGRTVATAEAVGLPFETDERWRGINVGEWEGLTYQQISMRDRDRWAAFVAGENIALGGGERISDVQARVVGAHRELVERLGPDGRALVISHGLAKVLAVRGAIGVDGSLTMRIPGNTSMSTIASASPGESTLVRFNDVVHLDVPEPPGHEGDTRVVLVRHGETEANIEGRWQGHEDSPLTGEGEAQTELLAAHPPLVDVVYSSPTPRAHRTASAMAAALGKGVSVDDRLKEIGFGRWEGSTVAEIRARDAELFDRIRLRGEDVTRGGTGETFADVRTRMTAAIEGMVAAHPRERIGVVSHGGSTRAYVSGVLGLEFGDVRRAIRSLGNTGVAHVGYDHRGPALIAWNVTGQPGN